MRSRSHSAKPAMMVRISLPLAVLRSKLNPVCARTLTFQIFFQDPDGNCRGASG
jgi:hypothetical protein